MSKNIKYASSLTGLPSFFNMPIIILHHTFVSCFTAFLKYEISTKICEVNLTEIFNFEKVFCHRRILYQNSKCLQGLDRYSLALNGVTTMIISTCSILLWRHSVVVITTAQLYSTKSELRFCTESNPAHGVSKIRSGEDIWQWLRPEIKLNAFRRSTIPRKQFIIIHHHQHLQNKGIKYKMNYWIILQIVNGGI